MNIIKAFENAFKRKKDKNWDYIYIAIDVHDTIFKASYSRKNDTCEFFPYAAEALRLISQRQDIKLILWTSSYEVALGNYLRIFDENGINFQYVNSNPEIDDCELASFKDKFYFNVGLDDKFGFEPDKDWKIILNYFSTKGA